MSRERLERILSGVLPALEHLYTQPIRHYHNLAHIRACCAQLDQHRNAFADDFCAELAFWFHDAIYDSMRADNERRSADLAGNMLREYGLSDQELNRIDGLIMVTRHNGTAEVGDQQLFVDIDLAILAASHSEFDAYETAIRYEYAHVPDALFTAGRTKILRGFLARPRIYQTDLFAGMWEPAARANLERSIRLLGESS